MASTTLIRSWWAPACQGPWARVALYGEGTVSVSPKIVEATHALSACLERWSYESRAADTGAYNCRQITGGTNYSLHAYGIAIDINWQSNPYGPTLITDMPKGMIEAIKAIRTKNGKTVWRWGGDYTGNKDAMHFEVIAHPNDLATGINPATIPSTEEDPFMALSDGEQREMLEHLRRLDPWPPEKLGTDGKVSADGKPAARHLRWISETVERVRRIDAGQ